jgi:beta-N-acetylhexosaminidase
VLFRRNVRDGAQLQALTAQLSELAPPGLPPILAIDEEGGAVSRLDHLGFDAPAALAQGATGDPARAREVAELVGATLKALGLNTVFAPCLDVLTEPLNPVIATRAYGDGPEQVTRFGIAALEGFRATGIATVVKHFPGHGGTRADSHVAEPVVRRGAEAMMACDLAPFRAAIAGGVPGVMSAHVRYPDATPESDRNLPATLSRYWLGEMLRGELGFAGPVLSDALEMAGAGREASLEERIERGLAAGVDLLLFDELEHGLAARDHLARLASDPRWRERLADAAARVTTFRRRLPRREGTAGVHEAADLLRAPHPRFAAIQGAAIALVADPQRRLPLARSNPVFVAMPRSLDADRKIDLSWLAAELGERFPAAQVVPFDPGPTAPAVLARAASEAQWTGTHSRAAVVLASLGRGDPEWIRSAAAAVGDGPGPRLGVALHRPAEVLEMPATWTRLITYGFGRNALRGMVQVLAGEHQAVGNVLGLRPPAAGARI